MVVPDNYNSANDDYVAHNGIWMYPPPGEVIIDEAGQGQPCFDCGKAATFMELTIADIRERLNHWLVAVNRITGGLRP